MPYDIVDGSRNYSFTFGGPSVDVRKLLYPEQTVLSNTVKFWLATTETDTDDSKDNDEEIGLLDYDRVVFNPPATIVLWEDGTKTVVKCGENDVYDPEKGLALCFMKKALGNTSRALNDILHAEIRHENKEEA